MRKNKLIFFIFLLIGAGLMNYPFVSQWINRKSQGRVIYNYNQASERLSQEGVDEILEAAKVYNSELAECQEGLADGFSAAEIQNEEYESILNPTGDGMMGYVEIPAIDVMLPIYHGTGVRTLEKGAGHLVGSSLPVGGENTHSVISAHAGLASKAMFTDLDRLEIGDRFYMYILNEVLAYEVKEINIVKPEETEKLEIVPGEDLVTLVTCTPYGINSHRLLVKGVRIPYSPEEQKEDKKHQEDGFWVWCRRGFIASVVILAGVAIVLFKPESKGRKRKNERKGPDN